MSIFLSQAYYNEMYNVTKYIPSLTELIEDMQERKSKASRSRMLNKELQGALDTFKDLNDAVMNSNGMLHGAKHTINDIIKYNTYIINIYKCIEINKSN